MSVEAYVGKSINHICGNGFHDPAANHCAHFVCHALGLGFSFNCKQFVGGSKPAANIRVHEVFAECPKVGWWQDADKTRRQLVFVTRKNVVNLAAGTMQNIPQKHIGIFQGGLVYHYSNTEDKVVTQTPEAFYQRFQNAYDGDQGLYFGIIPGESLQLTVDPSGATAPAPSAFTLTKEGNRWFGKRTGDASPKFLVGAEILKPAKKFFGLFMPGAEYYGPVYDPTEHYDAIDQWAYLLDLTTAAESAGRMNLINTYDRARFTFGFYQLAAHTPRDNLILYFKAAMADADFRTLFPDLEMRAGRLFRVSGDGTAVDLEVETHDPQTGEDQLQRFMAYLNPNRTTIDAQEVLQAARMIWWANNQPKGNALQVRIASQILQNKVTQRYMRWYALNGRKDTVVALVADIHHQGRGSRVAVKAALAKPDPEAELLKIGAAAYPERIATLKARLKKWRDAGKMGVKRFDAAAGEFR